jgi:hypothetical protein
LRNGNDDGNPQYRAELAAHNVRAYLLTSTLDRVDEPLHIADCLADRRSWRRFHARPGRRPKAIALLPTKARHARTTRSAPAHHAPDRRRARHTTSPRSGSPRSSPTGATFESPRIREIHATDRQKRDMAAARDMAVNKSTSTGPRGPT